MPGLLDPISIKNLHISNRLVMPPMANQFATEDGEVTDRLIDHYRERAPGVGLVIVEHFYVLPEGRVRVTQPGIHHDGLIPGLARLVEEVHKTGAKIGVQINHAGSKAPPEAINRNPAGPSPVAVPNSEVVPQELTAGEIERIVAAFGQAARRACEAGFDCVEVHGAHGYLNNQFLSPLTNKRTDQYGGALDNRLRLPLQMVKEVLEQVDQDCPVLFRLGAADFIDGGFTEEEGVQAAKKLVNAGVAAIDVAGGHYGIFHPDNEGQGFFIPSAERIKKAVQVPVIWVGGITEPAFADRVIREGRLDMVAVGRGMLKDPEWARKAAAILSAGS